MPPVLDAIRCLVQVPQGQREGDASGEERPEQEPGTVVSGFQHARIDHLTVSGIVRSPTGSSTPV
jgi:hypothetical protein